MFVLCLRDVTERRESEQAMRESAARYQLLVDHAPEAIVVLDADTGRFVDANDNAQKLFGLEREQLLTVGPVTLSPPRQPDGEASEERARADIERALEGEPQVFEWPHCDAQGREIICEVRLVRLPSGKRRLVRGSIADISERKRAERMAAAERQVFEQITRNASLAEVLASITLLIESALSGTACSVSVLAEDGQAFAYMVAPRLPQPLRAALEQAAVGIRTGSCAAGVYLGRQVLVADVAKDPFWQERREAALEAGQRAAWSTPIKAAGGAVLGSLGVYRAEPGLPSGAESQIMARAAQLAGIAIERRRAEEALRGSEAKFRGLFESIAEGVYQSGRDGRLLSVNPAFVGMLGYASAEELYALLGGLALLESRLTAPSSRGASTRRARSATRNSSCAARRPAAGDARERAPDARRRGAPRRLRGHDRRHHRAQARRAGGVRREGARAGDAAVDRRRGDQHRRRRSHRVHQPGRREPHRLEPRRGARPADRRGAESRQRAHARADREFPVRRARARRRARRRPITPCSSRAPATRSRSRNRRPRSATARAASSARWWCSTTSPRSGA